MVITTLAALTGAIAFLALREPSYEATANVLVTALPQDDQTFLGLSLLRDSGDSTRTTQTAATLLDSPEAARLAASELGPGWTQRRVEDSVDVSPQGDSNIIAITGAANNPGLSTQVADEFTAAALEVRAKGLEQQVDDAIKLTSTELDKTAKKDPNAFELSARLTQLRSIQDTGDPTLTFQQQATIPTSPTNPGPVIVIPLALIAGFALGSGAALMRELLDRRIVDVEDAIAIYPLPVLARVPRLPKREGDHPPGASWHMAPEAMEALRTLILQFEQRERPLGTVLITSPTRGDGKTTSSINLATMLAATGRQVVLLDFDLRNPRVASALGLRRTHRPEDILDPNSHLAQLLVPTSLEKLLVLPSSVDREGVSNGEAAGRRARDLVVQAQAMADCVVVDTPPLGEVSDALRLVPAVEDVLVVLRAGNTSSENLEQLRDVLERAGRVPEGYVVIGAERAGRGYYGHYGPREPPDLFVGRPAAAFTRPDHPDG